MWDERFSEADPVYGDAPNVFLRAQAAGLEPGSSILLPGDGYGRNGVWLARQGFRVHSVDLSIVGVERARRAAHAAGLEMLIEQADLSNWNWPVQEFGAIAAIFLHLPPEARVKIHAFMLRALKPGGSLILEAFTPAQLHCCSGGPKQVELLYTAEMLRGDFADAEIVELIEAQVDLDEGRMHRGRAAVVRGVFRKK
jgi:SAM-dependent methyltransferase